MQPSPGEESDSQEASTTRTVSARRLYAWAAIWVQASVPRHLPDAERFVGIVGLTLDGGNDVGYVYATGCKRNRQRFRRTKFKPSACRGPHRTSATARHRATFTNSDPRDRFAFRGCAHCSAPPPAEYRRWIQRGHQVDRVQEDVHGSGSTAVVGREFVL